jgi:exonuclease I
MLDIAHSILQNGEGFNEKATDSFQEVRSDLYDGFLSAEDRK